MSKHIRSNQSDQTNHDRLTTEARILSDGFVPEEVRLHNRRCALQGEGELLETGSRCSSSASPSLPASLKRIRQQTKQKNNKTENRKQENKQRFFFPSHFPSQFHFPHFWFVFPSLVLQFVCLQFVCYLLCCCCCLFEHDDVLLLLLLLLLVLFSL